MGILSFFSGIAFDFSYLSSVKIVSYLFVLSIALFLTSCGPSISGSDSNPALGGYCPVCYFTADQAVKGSSEYQATYEGKTYYFNSAKSVTAFNADPEKYLPAYDGWCAYGVAVGAKVPVDPRVFSVVDGRLYLNKNRWVGRSFDKDQKGYITQANEKWPEL